MKKPVAFPRGLFPVTAEGALQMVKEAIGNGNSRLNAIRWTVDACFPFIYEAGESSHMNRRNEIIGSKRKKLLDYLEASREVWRIWKEFQPQVVYDVHSLDVWGNAREGFDVNQEFKAGEIEVPESHGSEDIFDALVEGGFLMDGVQLVDTHGYSSRLRKPSVIVSDDSSEGFYAVRDARAGHGEEPLYHLYLKRD